MRMKSTTAPTARRRSSHPIAVLIGLAFAAANPAFAAPSSAPDLPSVEATASVLHDYRAQQFQRLATRDDADSLIAAALIGLPVDSDAEGAALPDEMNLLQRLVDRHPSNTLALYTATLACQLTANTCPTMRYREALVQLAPDNAVHWLLLPNKAPPSDVDLRGAAAAAGADSHLREIVGTLRTALADQPLPESSNIKGMSVADRQELALRLRRELIEQVPMPKFKPLMDLCKTGDAQRRADCITVGQRLYADASGAILPRMIGSVLLRRLLKGTPTETAAKEFRRQYTWLSEQLPETASDWQEPLQRDTVQFGEWEAMQRSAERRGAQRIAPDGWLPKDPQTLLLSEDRTGAKATR